MLIEFDAADSSTSCTRRERSNTPTQALTLWNDPVFIECAQALGRRMIQDTTGNSTGPTPTQQIDYVFNVCLSRRPSAAERLVLIRFYEKQRSRYQSDHVAAAALTGRATLPKGALRENVAAAIALARTIINLDEFITRE